MKVITIASEADLWKLPIRYSPWWVWKQKVFKNEKVSKQVSKLMRDWPQWDPSIVCSLPRTWPNPWVEWRTMDKWGNLREEPRRLWSACRITCLGGWQVEEPVTKDDLELEMWIDDTLSRLEYEVSLAVTEWELNDARWLTIRNGALATWLVTEAETGRQRPWIETKTGGEIGLFSDDEKALGWRVYAPFTRWRAGE